MISGSCYGVYGEIGDTLFYAYCLVWFLGVRLLPVTMYVGLHGKVIVTLYRKKTSTYISCSKVIEFVQWTITKTATTF